MKVHMFMFVALMSLTLGCNKSVVDNSKSNPEPSNSDSDTAMVDSNPVETLAVNKEAENKNEANKDAGTTEKETESTTNLNARTVLADSLASAKAADKKLLVHFGSPG